MNIRWKRFSYLLMKLSASLGMSYGKFGRFKIPISSGTWKFLFKEIFLNDAYYFETQNPNPIILDCGSNVGFAALYFKLLYPKSRIICFEASKQTYDKLRTTLDVNKINDIRTEQIALGNQDNSQVNFYRNSTDGNDLGSALLASGIGTSEQVQMKKLSSYIAEPIDFLKLDIEGAETSVFEDLVSSGKINFLKSGAIEFHLNVQNPSNNLGMILQSLYDHGFVYRITSFSIVGRPWRPTQTIAINFVKDVSANQNYFVAGRKKLSVHRESMNKAET